MRQFIVAIAIFVVASALTSPVQAQPDIQPVFTENSIDGMLIGLEGGYGFESGFGTLKPFLGIAYGLDSQKIRHKLGLQVGSLRVSHVDWMSSAVLGREGEMGWKFGTSLMGMANVSVFAGELWQKSGTSPNVGYLHIASNKSFDLGNGITLSYWSKSVWGAFMPISQASLDKLFYSKQQGVSLAVGQFTLVFSMGQPIENKAQLENFQFTNAIVGYEEKPLKGEEFWKFALARRFPVLSIPLDLKRPAFWPESAPWLEELPLQGLLFFEGLNSTHKEAGKDAISENIFGWGAGLELTVMMAKLQAKIIFDRDGKHTFKLEF
jgi:hypothetical protein